MHARTRPRSHAHGTAPPFFPTAPQAFDRQMQTKLWGVPPSVVCTNTDAHELKDGRVSFPSGARAPGFEPASEPSRSPYPVGGLARPGRSQARERARWHHHALTHAGPRTHRPLVDGLRGRLVRLLLPLLGHQLPRRPAAAQEVSGPWAWAWGPGSRQTPSDTTPWARALPLTCANGRRQRARGGVGSPATGIPPSCAARPGTDARPLADRRPLPSPTPPARPRRLYKPTNGFWKRVWKEMISATLLALMLFQLAYPWGVGVSRVRDNRHNASDVSRRPCATRARAQPQRELVARAPVAPRSSPRRQAALLWCRLDGAAWPEGGAARPEATPIRSPTHTSPPLVRFALTLPSRSSRASCSASP